MTALSPFILSIGDKIDSSFFAFDSAIFSFFGNLQNSVLTFLAKFFTSFGDEVFVIPIVILALILCLFKRSRRYGVALAASVVIGTLLTNVIFKPLVLRIRPYNTLQLTGFWEKFSVWYKGAGALSESDYSFPSGHTTGAFDMAIPVFLLMRKNKKKIAWIFPVIAILVGCSRIYLMVHYPTDVFAGVIIGVFLGICGYYISKAICAVFEKISALDKIDIERLFKKTINSKLVGVIITVFIVVILSVSFVRCLNDGADYVETCAYNEEYNCMNEARIDDDKYPTIDGKNYCKIHWKQLTGNQEQ